MTRFLYILFLIPFFGTGQLAFPTAEGFGKNVTGGRGGAVIHVTNLNDTGAGSLRAALDTQGARTIVFDVAGDIEINSLMQIGGGNCNSDPAVSSIPYDDITIAGETAPSPGITIRAGTTDGSDYGALISVKASNVIIRYISLRVDDNDVSTMDALQVVNQWDPDNSCGTYYHTLTNVIIDHVSMSNGSDEIFAMEGVTNSTVQNSMITDSDHSGYAYLFGEYVYNHSFLGNYMSHSSYRNPLIGYGNHLETSEWINNIVYGYDTGGMTMVWGNVVDAIGNVYKAWENNEPNTYSINWNYNSFNSPGNVVTDGEFYTSNNFQANPAKHQYGLYNSDATTYVQPARVITNSLITSWETTLSTIEDRVFNSSSGSNGPGNSLYQDAFDAQAIADYAGVNERKLNSFIPDKTLVSRPGSDDSDNDDMLDVAEIAVWGDITTTNNPIGDEDSDGYTNIEETFFYFTGELQAEPEPPTPDGKISSTNIRPKVQLYGSNGKVN